MRRARWVAGVAALAMACNGDHVSKAGIMLSLATDMTVPESIDEVGLYIEHVKGGQRTLVVSQEQKPLFNPRTGDYELRFTASFAVVASDDPTGDAIRSRFVGFGKDGKVIAMREARVSMPDQDVRQLRLPLLFVNEGRVEDTLGGAVAPAGAGVGLQQVQEGSRTDPFQRWRHPGCADEQTLGDDGECTPIDVDPSTLPVLGENASAPPCVDTLQCFGGARGVRELSLNADCTVSTAGLGADQLALALRTGGGYSDLHAQFIPENLYTFDRDASVLALKKPLCDRAKTLGVSRVLVSVRCAPMAKEAAICAPWQDAPAPVAPNESASFPTDPPLPDGDAPDTDGPADSSGDTGQDSGEELQAFTRAIGVPTGLFLDRLAAFAASPGGKTWILLRGSDVALGGVAEAGDANVVEIPLGNFNADSTSYLWLGADDAAYIHREYGPPLVLADGGAAYGAVSLGATCGQQGASAQYFSVGSVGDKTIAMYGGSGGSPPRGSVAEANDPSCFRNTAPIVGASASFLYRGMDFRGKFQIPAVNQDSFLRLDPASDAGGTTVPFAPMTYSNDGGFASTVIATSLVDVGAGNAVLVAKSFIEQDYDTLLYGITANGDVPTPGSLLATQPTARPSREVFGGGDVLCMRLHDPAENFRSLRCYRNVTQGMPVAFGWSGSYNVDDLHIYGDSKYLYIAKACFADTEVTSIKMRATPWAQVTDATAGEVLVDCPNQLQDVGRPE